MAEAGGTQRRPGYVLLLTTVCLGGVLAPLNSTMLAVALPEVRESFSVGHKEIGWLVSAYLIAMAVAQPVGGRLGDQLGRARVFQAGLAAGSWRWLFLMNASLVTAALVSLTLLRYPEKRGTRAFSLDWAGALFFAALLVSVTFLLTSMRGGEDVYLLAAAVISLLLSSALFLQRQVSSPTPIAEWKLFRNRSYSAATSYILLSNLVMYTTLPTVPFFVEEVQGRGNAATGTLLASMSVLMAVVSPLSGRISDGRGRRQPAVAGSVIMQAAVAVVLVGMDGEVSYGYLAAALTLLGLGLGLSFGAASTAAVESAPRELAGAAAGTNSMMRYTGSIIGAGVLGAVLSSDAGAPGIGLFRLIFAVLTGAAALACLSTVFIHRFPPERIAGQEAVVVPDAAGTANSSGQHL